MATTADDVWRLLAELVEAQKETDRKFQETDHQMQETDRKIQETTQTIERVNRQLSQQLGALGGKWGQFVENLVAPACKTLFLERGIPVHQVSQRVKRFEQGDTLEIDVLVQNQHHVLAVEVKSTLGVEDIQAFMEDLGRFHQFFLEQGERQPYGAVAAITL